MSSGFAEIVEDVKALSTQEKQELQGLIEKYLIEERREEMLQNQAASLAELNAGKIEFSRDLNKLKGMLLSN